MTDSPDRASPPATAEDRRPALRYQRIALVDLLDRVLAGGVVIMGEVRLAIADVDLVTVSLQALISSVSSIMDELPDPPPGQDQAGQRQAVPGQAVRGQVVPEERADDR